MDLKSITSAPGRQAGPLPKTTGGPPNLGSSGTNRSNTPIRREGSTATNKLKSLELKSRGLAEGRHPPAAAKEPSKDPLSSVRAGSTHSSPVVGSTSAAERGKKAFNSRRCFAPSAKDNAANRVECPQLGLNGSDLIGGGATVLAVDAAGLGRILSG